MTRTTHDIRHEHLHSARHSSGEIVLDCVPQNGQWQPTLFMASVFPAYFEEAGIECPQLPAVVRSEHISWCDTIKIQHEVQRVVWPSSCNRGCLFHQLPKWQASVCPKLEQPAHLANFPRPCATARQRHFQGTAHLLVLRFSKFGNVSRCNVVFHLLVFQCLNNSTKCLI